MSTLKTIGDAWGTHCRRLCPDEAGALWALVAMAHDSRVRGSVVARADVLAAAWNLGYGERAARRARELLTGLRKKRAVTVDENAYTGMMTVTVVMFDDLFERRRERNRRRMADYHA